VTRHWRRQDLVVRAFHRHFEQLRAQSLDGSVAWLVSTSDEDPDDAGGEKCKRQ
jgi:hypothetical protein